MCQPIIRQCVRALILTPDSEILLLRLLTRDHDFWITPGGGIEPGESHEQALRRELREELGRDDLPIGPHIWVREGTYNWHGETRAEREYFYLVRSERFVADSSGNPEPGEREILAELKWWPAEELPRQSKSFAPARLGQLVGELLSGGVPPRPVDTGF